MMLQRQTAIAIIIVVTSINNIILSNGLYTDVTSIVGLSSHNVQLQAFGDFNSDNSADMFVIDESSKSLSLILLLD